MPTLKLIVLVNIATVTKKCTLVISKTLYNINRDYINQFYVLGVKIL